MKTTEKKKQTSLEHYAKNEIKNPETISGGEKGPIDRDKIKRPTVR